MIDGLRLSSSPIASWGEAEGLASIFGPKGARLLTLPRAWTLPYALLSSDLVERVRENTLKVDEWENLLHAINDLNGSHSIIVRSSVIGETIWERGTYASEVVNCSSVTAEEFLHAIKVIYQTATNRELALVVQQFVKPDDWGEFGNLARISKTRDQWEFSSREKAPVVQQARYNSQRDTAHDRLAPLLAKPRLPRERLFGSVSAWINNELVRGTNDRVNCEWIRRGNEYFVVQVDREDEDVFGVNPMQLHIPPSILPAGNGELVRFASVSDRQRWDKLLVLDQLFADTDEIVPSLFWLAMEDATAERRELIAEELAELLVKDIVIRVSVRSDAEKINNLPKTDCLAPDAAADWCVETARRLSADHPGVSFAFVAHRFIASAACAWVRADPNSPTVEVHGNWGLPDALQFCPYDIWEVHFPGEQITELPAYKSDVLVNTNGGRWEYQRVKNDIARHQSLSRQQVLDIARRSLAISRKLGEPCHVMWFVGCQTNDGREANVPWYRVPAHGIDQPHKRAHTTFRVAKLEDLANLAEIKRRSPAVAVDLRPESEALLRDNVFLKAVADAVVPLGMPVQLQGSTLAHAFFQLRLHGVVVIGAGDKEHVRPRNHKSYAKLVRDKIPGRIAAQQEKQALSVAPEEYRGGYLIGKLVEEALEAREAKTTDERLVELADVFEVLRALIGTSGHTMQAVTAAAKKKREKSGGFETGTLLWETRIPTSGEILNSTEAPSDAELLVDTIGQQTVKLPFTFFGFSEIGSSRTVELHEMGVSLRLTLQRDAVEIEVNKLPVQLPLDL